jgi:hypothetical protein
MPAPIPYAPENDGYPIHWIGMTVQYFTTTKGLFVQLTNTFVVL